MIGGGPKPGGGCSTAEKRERERKYIRWEGETAATESQYTAIVVKHTHKHWINIGVQDMYLLMSHI